MKQSKQTVRNKTHAIRFLLILLGLFVVLLILNLLLDGTVASWFQKETDPGPKEPIFFYDADYDLDIWEEEDYLALERRIRYTEGAQTIYLANETDCRNTGDMAIFFWDYFHAIINGDYQQFPLYFSEEYRAEQEIPECFTMQQLYEIEVVKLREYTVGDGTAEQSTVYEFQVGYRIRRNNGTFRDDLASHDFRAQIYQLYQNDFTGQILIHQISEYNRA